MTIELKRNVPGFRDANGVFHPLRSASYIPSGKGRRKATTRDKKKYSRAKAGDLGKARQERALEDPWDREIRLEREAAAKLQKERDRIEREIAGDIYGESSGRTSRGKARSLVQYVRAQGGINTKFRLRRGKKQIGDLANYTLKDSGKRGLVTTTPGKGLGLDGMWQSAREAGYDVSSTDDLLARLDSEIAGGPVTYSTHGSMSYNPAAKQNPIKVLKHKFYVGQKLATRFIGDYDLILRGVVVSRTPKFVTVKVEGDRELKRCGVRVWGDTEMIYPTGRYSMAPSFRAKDGDRVGNPTAKKNAADPNRAGLVKFLTIRGYGGLAKEVKAGGDMVKAVKQIYGFEPPAIKAKLKQLIASLERDAKSPKKNPDPVSTFASLAWGIASSLHIKEMLTKPTARKAAKRRGTTTAKTKKRTNPAASLGEVLLNRVVDGVKVLYYKAGVNPWGTSTTHSVRFKFRISGKFVEMIAGCPSLDKARQFADVLRNHFVGQYSNIRITQRKINPAPSAKRSKGPKGDLYVLTIGSGDDLISVYLHDGDKDGFSKRFKTMAAAKAYATKSKVKLVSNPAAAKVNGIVSRAWARSRAKAEYARELRLAAAAERSRKRRSKFEGQARTNPASKHYTVKGTKNGRRVQFFTKAATPAAAIREIEKYQGEIKNAKATIFTDKMASAWFAARGDKMRIARAKSNPTNPRSAAGKKAVTRSAKANPRVIQLPIGFHWKKRQAAGGGDYFEITDPKGLIVGWGTTRTNALRTFKTYGVKAKAQSGFSKDRAKQIREGARSIRLPARKNPKSTARRRTFEMFQGRKATTAKAMPVSRHAPANLDQLGDLVEIKLHGGKVIKFNPRKFKLTAARGKLWIVGGPVAPGDGSVPVHVVNPVAEIDHVVYGTRKPHHGDHAYTHYIHKLGEESGKRPILCVDREGFPVIRGGNYKIEARGIVD